MVFTVGAQTAQGIGTLLGQMFGGGVGQKDYAQGQLMGTQIRERKAKAALDEQQYSSIADAIKAGLAGNWQAANVNSLYGGHGRTSFDVTNQGAVFNKNTGEVDVSNGIAQAFMKLKGAEAANQNLQGDYYRSKAETERGLLNERERVEIAKALFDEARAKDVTSMIAPKQEAILAQAFARMAQGRQFDAAAGLNNARANEVNSLVDEKAKGLLSTALAREAQARQYDSAAGLNNARAGEVASLIDEKAKGLLSTALAREAQARQYDSAAGLNNARAGEVASLIDEKAKGLLSTALAREAQARQYDSAAGLNNARAKEVTDLTPSKLEGIAAQTFARNAQGRQFDSVAGYNNARAKEVEVLTPLAQQLKAAGIANQMGLAARNHQLAESTPAVQQSIVNRNNAVAEKAQQVDRSKLLENPVIANVLGQIRELDKLLSEENPNQPLFIGRGVYNAAAEKEKLLQQRMSLQSQLNSLLGAGTAAPATNAGSDPLAQARAAIAKGADPAKVRARLQSMGIDAGGL